MIKHGTLRTALLPSFSLPVFVVTSVLGLAVNVETRKLASDFPQELTYFGYDVAQVTSIDPEAGLTARLESRCFLLYNRP